MARYETDARKWFPAPETMAVNGNEYQLQGFPLGTTINGVSSPAWDVRLSDEHIGVVIKRADEHAILPYLVHYRDGKYKACGAMNEALTLLKDRAA